MNSCCQLLDIITSIATAITALVGLVLGFIGVKLSAISLKETANVRKEVTSQDFKLKQAKLMADLVNRINTYEFQIVSNYNYKSIFGTANLVGLTKLSDSKYIEYIDKEMPVSYSKDMIFDIFDGYDLNAYMPSSIAILLTQFSRDYIRELEDEQYDERKDHFYICNPNTIERHYIEMYNPDSIYANVPSLVNHIEKLLDEINEWFMLNNGMKPNLIPINNLEIQK